MTALLDRLDDKVAETVAGVGGLEIAGWICVGVGGLTAVVSAGVVVTLYFLGDLMTVGDFL